MCGRSHGEWVGERRVRKWGNKKQQQKNLFQGVNQINLLIQLIKSKRKGTMGHYCIETNSGKLELSKGAYLTMMKRKTNKTLTKRKPITHFNEKKSTVKKHQGKHIGRSLKASKQNELVIKDRFNNSYTFGINSDSQVFESQVTLPSIEIEYDNDIESEWGEIEENVGHLTLALSIATFDNHFNR